MLNDQTEGYSICQSQQKIIAMKFTDPKIFLPEIKPSSVYMAGSPGAGKTEASISLLDAIKQNEGNKQNEGQLNVLRIDSDELRSKIEDYTGNLNRCLQRFAKCASRR